MVPKRSRWHLHHSKIQQCSETYSLSPASRNSQKHTGLRRSLQPLPRVDPRSSASRKSRSSRRTLMLEHQQPLRCSSSPLHTHHRCCSPLTASFGQVIGGLVVVVRCGYDMTATGDWAGEFVLVRGIQPPTSTFSSFSWRFFLVFPFAPGTCPLPWLRPAAYPCC